MNEHCDLQTQFSLAKNTKMLYVEEDFEMVDVHQLFQEYQCLSTSKAGPHERNFSQSITQAISIRNMCQIMHLT